MIEVRYRGGRFEAKGTFDWGVIGVYENKEFGVGAIEINLELEDLQGEKAFDYHWLQPLRSLFAGKEFDGDAAAAILTDYYNGLEQTVIAHHEQLKNYFLYMLMENLVDTEYPFWERGNVLTEGYDEADASVYDGEWTDAFYHEISDLVYAIHDKNKSQSMADLNVDMTAFFKAHLPMFDLEKLFAAIRREGLCFEGACMEVQFSDDWDGDYEFFCCAYENFTPDLRPMEWHNF